MKYGHDQREWVRTANEKLPQLIEQAKKLQLDAAEAWRACQAMPSLGHTWVSEMYADARFALLRVIYYQGMRNANLPASED